MYMCVQLVVIANIARVLLYCVNCILILALGAVAIDERARARAHTHTESFYAYKWALCNFLEYHVCLIRSSTR